MKLREALDIKPGEVISLVGGGGKTTLMFALALELVSGGKSAVTTTTTKIFEPPSSETGLLLLESDEEKMMKRLLQNIVKYRHITVASEKSASGKLRGVSSELIGKLAELNQVSYIIVEADGAAGRSLKAPGFNEPVIPPSTSLVIPMVGIGAVGCCLTEEHVFRPGIVSKLLGLPLGEIISAEAVAFLVTSPQGLIKASPAKARIVPFINKVDLNDGLAKGRDLANRILEMKHLRIEQVALGHARLPEPVVEVISRGISRD